jgi:hypothetical protein
MMILYIVPSQPATKSNPTFWTIHYPLQSDSTLSLPLKIFEAATIIIETKHTVIE